MKPQMKTPCYVLCLASTLMVWGCNSNAPTRFEQKALQTSFADLQIGQQWRYVKWEKFRDQDRKLTGDSVVVTIIAKENDLITLQERFIPATTQEQADTLTFNLRHEGSRLRLVGNLTARVFSFLGSHDGVLLLTPVDSNRVAINLDDSLFDLRQQTGKNHFVGHSEAVQLFLQSYEDLTVYYDERITYVDGNGHVALFSAEQGVVGTVFFGGFSLFEQYGFELIKP